ncbi:lysylphosphatidylglycerol synthase transmembrane domain-containing protein [Kitasatospora purpeofusca]|uniref:lysylphosphatidylglycerol synthase transmembrane domain-containing protein n=1 Tax=Kitasatospora purpeofusca TaxID=67352 RepID=UPI002A599CA6|nr:lysylphosphatidylglycerol synthase transmembrane domain-containing protein [Kitasatospora purpeofusca]MDY0812187.1 lysylphosphatidylglycerol synthase transmembrane domain-containing protein [Kitasatospora purpeofusca]
MADAAGNATSDRTGGTVEGTDDSTGGGTGGGTGAGTSDDAEGGTTGGRLPPPGLPGIAATGRLRQPAALIRLLAGLVVIALTLLSADYARATTNGLAEDVGGAAALVPHPLGGVATGLTTAALLLLPGCSAARRLLAPGTDRRHVLQQLADGVLAATLAYGVTLLFALWIDGPAPFPLVSALTRPLPGAPLAHTEPVYGYLAPVLAFLTASAARERRVPWTVLTLSALAGIAAGAATPTALLLGVLIGWTAAHGTRWAVGTPDPRPRPGQLLHSLREAGLHPVSVTPDGPDRYLVRQRGDHPDLDVQLLDRQAVTAALVQRAWRRLRLRTAPHPRALRSLRTGLEHEALVSYATVAAGVRTRPVAATAELGRDAALVAYRRLPGRTLDELADEEVTDALLVDVWGQLALLQRRAIAHRALVPSALLVDPAGVVHLVGLADGDIAAGELVLLSDIAQLLTTLALRTGAERSVRAAVSVLGPDAVAAALPLLQPIALAPGTRAALKQAARRGAETAGPRVPPQRTGPAAPAAAPAPAAGPGPDLLDGIRAEVLRSRPQAPVRPVRLERLRPRTLLAVVGGVVAGWLLLPQLFATEQNPIATVADADPFWLALAVLAAAAGHVAGAMGFVGFVPERLDFRNAVLAQVAGSFVKLVSPGGVGGVALNTRFLQRAGIPTAQALSSVGAGQLLGLVLHLLQLGAFVYLTGVQPGSSELDALQAVAGGLAVAGVLLASVSAVPPARRWLAARLRPLTAEVLPRLVELLRNPGRLAVGFTGQLLVSLTLIACLYCCARAVGREPAFASVGVVFLVGNAAGNAAPTPGGVGFVDGALVGLLELDPSMEDGGAAAAVVLFRLLTFVLPVLPGWAAFTWLQRRGAL